MKRRIAMLMSLLVLAAAGAAACWYGYAAVGWQAAPGPAVLLQGHPLARTQGVWVLPALGGLVNKRVQAPQGGPPADLGSYTAGQPLALALPEGYASEWTLARDGGSQTAGTAQSWPASLEEPGVYRLQVLCARQEGEAPGGYGHMTFAGVFAVEPPPRPAEPAFITGNTRLAQGDVFVMQVLYLPEGVRPQGATELGMCVFTPLAHEGDFMAAVPVGNRCAPGTYEVEVAAGEHRWQAQVTVEAFAFDEQNLTIDVSDPVISEANSAEAYRQYRETIPPLFATYDEERYWQGVFLVPAQGEISTPFGAIRYTNGDYANPGIHTGLDIAADEGAEVLAPNSGAVVLAEYLLNTGNTVVIEHGGGMKSYYYHMLALNVQAGDVVEKGGVIGQVGTTGYSTGPHLHFEMRIGDVPISPTMLFEETSGLYSLPPA